MRTWPSFLPCLPLWHNKYHDQTVLSWVTYQQNGTDINISTGIFLILQMTWRWNTLSSIELALKWWRMGGKHFYLKQSLAALRNVQMNGDLVMSTKTFRYVLWFLKQKDFSILSSPGLKDHFTSRPYTNTWFEAVAVFAKPQLTISIYPSFWASLKEEINYSIPQSYLMPNVDQVLCDIVRSKYMIVPDVLEDILPSTTCSDSHEILLCHDSPKGCTSMVIIKEQNILVNYDPVCLICGLGMLHCLIPQNNNNFLWGIKKLLMCLRALDTQWCSRVIVHQGILYCFVKLQWKE